MSIRAAEDIQSGWKPVNISVHFGAFATSASFIQSVLKSQTDHLRKHGVCYLGPNQLRGANGLISPRSRENRLSSACADLNAGVLKRHVEKHLECYPLKHLILSDGALLGSARRMTIDGRLYPDAKIFLSALPRWIDNENTTVFLSVRHLGDLLSEEICRVAMQRRIPDIPRLEKTLWNNLGSWSQVIASLRSHYKKSKMMIWRHEDFQQVSDTVLRSLTGGAQGHFKGAEPTTLLSSLALDYMRKHADASGKVDIPSLRLRYAMKHFPISVENPGFSIGDTFLRSHLDARYRNDWAEIVGMWPESVLRHQ